MDAAPAGSGWNTELSLLLKMRLPARRMARLHALNIQSWGRDVFARAAFDRGELNDLAQALSAIADGTKTGPPVEYVMRQLVLSRGKAT